MKKSNLFCSLRRTTSKIRRALGRCSVTLLCALVFVFSAAISAVASDSTEPADTLDVATLVRAALEHSTPLKQSVLRGRLARLEREAVLDARRTSWIIAAEPVYGLITRRAADFTSLTGISDFPPEPRTSFTHSVGAGVSAVHPLPSSGILSAGLSNAVQVTRTHNGDHGTMTAYALRPELRASVSQPLFVDGRVIDTEQPALTLENAEFAVREAEVNRAALADQVASAVIRLYSQLAAIQRALELQLTEIHLGELRFAEAEIRLEGGQGDRNAVLALRGRQNRLIDTELQLIAAADEVAIELSLLTGLAITADSVLAPIVINADRWDDAYGTTDASRLVANPQMEATQIAVARAETAVALAQKQARANASIGLVVSPRYADDRQSPDVPTRAITDFFGEGGGVDWRVSIDVNVPLVREAARNRSVEQARTALEIARLERADASSENTSRIALALRRIDTLERRLELARLDLQYEIEILDAERELVEIGMTTQLAIATLEAQVAARRAEILDFTSELTLETIELHRIRGKGPAELFHRSAGAGLAHP